jgi:hypothetical protein
MNPLAVLSAIVAVAVFPGVAYAGLVAALVALGGRIPAGLRPAQLDELMVAVGVSAACGLLAFPGSPLFGLPTGVSLVVFVTALAAGIAWGSAERWPWQRLAAVAAAIAPLLGLASVATTLDLGTIAAAGGSVGAARPWAVVAVLMALPTLVRPFDPHTRGWGGRHWLPPSAWPASLWPGSRLSPASPLPWWLSSVPSPWSPTPVSSG